MNQKSEKLVIVNIGYDMYVGGERWGEKLRNMTKNTIENKTKSNKQKKRESITHAF